MATLGVLFFQHLFAPWVDPRSASEYIAGMILLGVAPCTAMVFARSHRVNEVPVMSSLVWVVNRLAPVPLPRR